MKTPIESVSALPTKGIYRPIIADYALNTAVCELVDNAIDVWTRRRTVGQVTVRIDINIDQQSIEISDDAGGLSHADLRLLVTPGLTSTDSTDDTIGIFGVGAKRAPIALAQSVRIVSRKATERTVGIEYDDEWIDTPDWDVPTYRFSDIAPGSTQISLSKLRVRIDEPDALSLQEHLSATYGLFIRRRKIRLFLGGIELKGRFFDEAWRFPPSFKPRRHTTKLPVGENRSIEFVGTVGLIEPEDPTADEYGVYVYCNGRLIARAMKTPEVGFTTGLAGKPHHDVSIVRAVVELSGPARFMPWNSTKSGVNANSPAFKNIQHWLHGVMHEFGVLSRRLKTTWTDEVFPHTTGGVVEARLDDFAGIRHTLDIPIPRRRIPYREQIAELNAELAASNPWTLGLYEGIVAADTISSLKIRQRARITLIILDSTLEIALKDYLVHESGTHYTDADLLKLFSQRHQVVAEVRRHKPSMLDEAGWRRVNYFYGQRCKLVHERSTSGIDEPAIEEYRKLVQRILQVLFGIRFPLREV